MSTPTSVPLPGPIPPGWKKLRSDTSRVIRTLESTMETALEAKKSSPGVRVVAWNVKSPLLAGVDDFMRKHLEPGRGRAEIQKAISICGLNTIRESSGYQELDRARGQLDGPKYIDLLIRRSFEYTPSPKMSVRAGAKLTLTMRRQTYEEYLPEIVGTLRCSRSTAVKLILIAAFSRSETVEDWIADLCRSEMGYLSLALKEEADRLVQESQYL